VGLRVIRDPIYEQDTMISSLIIACVGLFQHILLLLPLLCQSQFRYDDDDDDDDNINNNNNNNLYHHHPYCDRNIGNLGRASRELYAIYREQTILIIKLVYETQSETSRNRPTVFILPVATNPYRVLNSLS